MWFNTIRAVSCPRRGSCAISGSSRTCGVSHLPSAAALLRGVQNAALYWLEAIAHVGQGATGDDAQCVVQISRLRELMKGNWLRVGNALYLVGSLAFFSLTKPTSF